VRTEQQPSSKCEVAPQSSDGLDGCRLLNSGLGNVFCALHSVRITHVW